LSTFLLLSFFSFPLPPPSLLSFCLPFSLLFLNPLLSSLSPLSSLPSP
jgi:hypothetical protein